MPTPNKGEKQGDYISRCMGNAEMNSKHPEAAQRDAVCHVFWDNYQKHGSIKGKSKMSNLVRAEIFSAGKFYPGNLNGEAVEFTEADLDHIVAAFDERASAGRVPLKLGHNDAQPVTDGQPALGWVSRVWREGGKLLADFTDMPSVVYDAIKNGLYKFISVELSKDVKTSGGLRSWALDAAALLGADIPAVGTLKDLQALTLSARGGLRPAAVFALTRGHQPTGERSTMTDQEIAELRVKFAAAEAEVVRLKAESDAREAEVRKEKVARQREAIRAQFTAAETAGRVYPRVQNKFIETRWFKDDEEVLKLSAADIETLIKEDEIPEAQRKPGGTGGGKAKMTAEKDEAFEALPVDAQFSQRVDEVAVEYRLDLTDHVQHDKAAKIVFRKYPELGKAYINMPGIAASARA
jgi:hypothetical protein